MDVEEVSSRTRETASNAYRFGWRWVSGSRENLRWCNCCLLCFAACCAQLLVSWLLVGCCSTYRKPR